MKSDKGNKVVILNKADYDDRMKRSIEEDNFKLLKKSPLNKMVNDAKSIIKEICKVFQENKYTLSVSNPSVPKMYGLPKVHKTGEQMRKIVSNVNSPLVKVAKWLVRKLKEYGNLEGRSLKNTLHFVEKVKNIEIEEDEILVSFDVTALFPSIPVDLAIESLQKHLETRGAKPEELKLLIKTAKICMSHNCFVFRNQFFKNEFGASMGNPLSPLIAEAFMTRFENELMTEELLPRVWYRYVDDVFSVIKKKNLEQTLETINSRYESIKFTYETEDNQQSIPFLDLKCTRKGKKIDFAVYRKHTSTDRFITSDSFCSHQHKIAAFHSLCHRLVHLPLSVNNYQTEFEYIVKLAVINGFNESLIEKIVKRHSDQKNRNNSSSLFSQNSKNESNNAKRVSFSYIPSITNQMRNAFEKENIQIVYSNNGKLKNILGSTKDMTPTREQSGIYEISCDDCDAKYIGQTKRNIEIRFKEHKRHIKNKHISCSSVAAHVFASCNADTPPHRIGTFEESIRLLKNIHNDRKLDAYESFYIANAPNAMNSDNGKITSPLFFLI